MAVDVLDRGVERVDDPDRHLHAQVLRVPVGVARLADHDVAGRRACRIVADQLHAGLLEVSEQPGQKALRDRGVDEQRLGRVADARALDLGVERDSPRHLEVGVVVDVDVAVARRGVHHGHRGRLLERRLQPLAAARDHEVDDALLGRQLGQLGALAALDELDRARRQARLGDGLAHQRRERGVRARRVARPPQHDRVAALQAQRGAIDGHVRPRLVDDRDDAERDPQLAKPEAAGERPLLDDLADRIGQLDDLAHTGRHRRDAVRVEREAVAQRGVEAGGTLVGDVGGVGLEHLLGSLAEQLGEAPQRGVLDLASRRSRARARRASRRRHTSGTLRVVVAMRSRVTAG